MALVIHMLDDWISHPSALDSGVAEDLAQILPVRLSTTPFIRPFLHLLFSWLSRYGDGRPSGLIPQSVLETVHVDGHHRAP
jgi:hypothetical protein